MKLNKINPSYPLFEFSCIMCKKTEISTHGYADLKGKPYNDYYCTECVNKIKKEGLGCDVELGGVGDTMKYGTILLVGGGLVYAMWKFNLFGSLRWFKDAMKDLIAAPKTIAIFENEQLNVRGSQIEKMFNILKQKTDNFTIQYGKLYDEWLKLKSKIKTDTEGYGKTFYESGKMQYFGSKSSKEKMNDKLDSFRTKVLAEVRSLQNKKGFKIKGDWTIINGLNCIPCLF